MRLIYHIVPASLWVQHSGHSYRAESLATEGFIHCSHPEQVARVANLFYADQPDLMLLGIDPARLTSPLRDEDIGTGESFPHVYGPIHHEAIVSVQRLERDAGNRWIFG